MNVSPTFTVSQHAKSALSRLSIARVVTRFFIQTVALSSFVIFAKTLFVSNVTLVGFVNVAIAIFAENITWLNVTNRPKVVKFAARIHANIVMQ